MKSGKKMKLQLSQNRQEERRKVERGRRFDAEPLRQLDTVAAARLIGYQTALHWRNIFTCVGSGNGNCFLFLLFSFFLFPVLPFYCFLSLSFIPSYLFVGMLLSISHGLSFHRDSNGSLF